MAYKSLSRFWTSPEKVALFVTIFLLIILLISFKADFLD